MSDDGSKRPGGWLFDENTPPPGNSAPRRPPNLRSLYFWLNVAFYVILLGLLFGASSQPWFFAVALAWMVTGVIVIRRSRRAGPPPPNLFDDRDSR